MKSIGVFVSENFQFLEVKFSIYLNRSVFVMCSNNDFDKCDPVFEELDSIITAAEVRECMKY